MRLIRMITGGLFCLFSYVSGLAQTENVKDAGDYILLVEKADSAIAAENYLLAIEYFKEAMRLEPANSSNIMLLSNTGMLQYYTGQDSLALYTLDVAHQIAPSSVTVLQNRARVNAGTGNFSRALADYTSITELDSTLVDPWIQRGILQLRGGDVRGAEASLLKAAELEPDSMETFVALSLLYSRTNRQSEALPFLNKLIKDDPSAEYYAERAMCRIAIDDLSGASSDIGEGIILDPDNPDLYIARALLNKRRFREKDSQTDVKEALRLGASQEYIKALGLKANSK